ncbi:hypothetical protein [Glycomyces salinus]|uniref:hypothetical protein n=1 Tax=Glycomyces salinus TaxID=980294 RepID=UPI0018EE3DB5|nr:hypothetical protein [Glycomyces salinus]
MPSPIVAQPPATAKSHPPAAPQAFTIRCAGCDGDEGLHTSDCPDVLAIGYDTGTGTASMSVYPEAGATLTKHADAVRSMRFYLFFGPVELHLEDGTVITFDELIR